jgi:hypothetical protein
VLSHERARRASTLYSSSGRYRLGNATFADRRLHWKRCAASSRSAEKGLEGPSRPEAAARETSAARDPKPLFATIAANGRVDGTRTPPACLHAPRVIHKRHTAPVTSIRYSPGTSNALDTVTPMAMMHHLVSVA